MSYCWCFAYGSETGEITVHSQQRHLSLPASLQDAITLQLPRIAGVNLTGIQGRNVAQEDV